MQLKVVFMKLIAQQFEAYFLHSASIWTLFCEREVPKVILSRRGEEIFQSQNDFYLQHLQNWNKMF